MKAQADIISAVIIIIIAIALVAAAYTWGIPLINKRQDEALVARAEKYFDRNNLNSLVKKIENIYKNGGEDTFTLDMDGLWIFYPCSTTEGGGCKCDKPACASENNSIYFTFFSRVTRYAIGEGWIPLSSPNINPIGAVGVDDSSVVFARADRTGEGFNITYKTWFRELDESPGKGYKINLIAPTDITTSTTRSLRITRGDARTISIDGKILIITEMKIYLV